MTSFGFVTNSLYGCVGGNLLGGLAPRSRLFQQTTRFIGGATLIALGVASAFTRVPHPEARPHS